MSKKKERWIEKLKNVNDKDLNFLILHSYINAKRKFEAGQTLFLSTFKESSSNLFYVSAEEYFKCLTLIQLLNQRNNHNLINKLAEIFIDHKIKIEESKTSAETSIKKKNYVILTPGESHEKGVIAGNKMKDSILKSLNSISSGDLLHIKNDSLYTGYSDYLKSYTSPIESFNFHNIQKIRNIIQEISKDVKKQINELYTKSEIESLSNYEFSINSRHSVKK